MSRRRISNREMKDIAESRMSVLLDLAVSEGISGNRDRSRRYFQLARAVSMRTNTPLPAGTMYCRSCLTPLILGRNCRVRLRRGKVVMHCLDCDAIRRRPYHGAKGDSNGEEADEKGAEGEGHRT